MENEPLPAEFSTLRPIEAGGGRDALVEVVGAAVAVAGDRAGDVAAVAVVVVRRRAAVDEVLPGEHLAAVEVDVARVDAGVDHGRDEVGRRVDARVAVAVAVEGRVVDARLGHAERGLRACRSARAPRRRARRSRPTAARERLGLGLRHPSPRSRRRGRSAGRSRSRRAATRGRRRATRSPRSRAARARRPSSCRRSRARRASRSSKRPLPFSSMVGAGPIANEPGDPCRAAWPAAVATRSAASSRARAIRLRVAVTVRLHASCPPSDVLPWDVRRCETDPRWGPRLRQAPQTPA